MYFGKLSKMMIGDPDFYKIMSENSAPKLGVKMAIHGIIFFFEWLMHVFVLFDKRLYLLSF